MSPTDNGAFCSSCQKEVFDFTKSTPHEIKEVLSKNETACVKITQHKLDELNFLEWFNHLNLSKRLKYVFLFAILIAQNSLRAQESGCYEPQFVAVDSVDLLTTEDVRNEILEVSESPVIQPYESIFSEGTIIHWVPNEEYIAIYGGIFIGTIIDPEPKTTPEAGVPLFMGDVVDYYAQDELVFTASINLTGNLFYFKIQNDSLIMDYNLLQDKEITLKISQDKWGPLPYGKNNIVFFAPLQLRQGEGQLKYPIKNFPTGSYTFMLSTKNEVGVARLTKW